MTTLADVLGIHDITVPDELIADVEVPVLTNAQRQGDVLIIPTTMPLSTAQLDNMAVIPATGVQVVRGEATGNTHLLHPAAGECRFSPATPNGSSDVRLGVLHVPDGGEAYLIHTDEHGANGIGPGSYVLHGKREQAEEIRRVAD